MGLASNPVRARVCEGGCDRKYFVDGMAIISRMPDSGERNPVERPITPVRSALQTTAAGETKTLCERCGAEAYRMHAVWRCPVCGFKSDCCGW